MAQIKVFDAVADTTTTTGTGTITLAGVAPSGYRTITGALSNSDNVVIRIESADRLEWEVCESVYTSSGTTMSRGTVLASSNSGSAVSFSAGTKYVYVTLAKELTAIGAMTTAGDLVYRDGTKLARLAVGGTAGMVLNVSSSLPAWTSNISVAGSVTSTSATAGMGYATGAGGTVTQSTSKTTGVTLNKICGAITMNAAALAAGSEAKFTVTNSAVAATDVVVVSIKSGGTSGSYLVSVAAVAAGSFDIVISNASGGSLSEAVVINFAIIKAVAA